MDSISGCLTTPGVFDDQDIGSGHDKKEKSLIDPYDSGIGWNLAGFLAVDAGRGLAGWRRRAIHDCRAGLPLQWAVGPGCQFLAIQSSTAGPGQAAGRSRALCA